MFMVTIETKNDATMTEIHHFQDYKKAKNLFDSLQKEHDKELKEKGILEKEGKQEYSYWDEIEEFFVALKPFEFED